MDKNNIDLFDMGYVMGFIVAEGSFSGDKKSARVAIKQKENREPLELCQELLGGRINGPYRYSRKGGGLDYLYDIWSLDGKQLVKALPLFENYLPSSEKRRRFDDWRLKYKI